MKNSREEAIEILNTPDEQLKELIARAEKLRRKYKGNCSQDCAYCAQSCRSKAEIDKYKWVSDDKIYRHKHMLQRIGFEQSCY